MKLFWHQTTNLPILQKQAEIEQSALKFLKNEKKSQNVVRVMGASAIRLALSRTSSDICHSIGCNFMLHDSLRLQIYSIIE